MELIRPPFAVRELHWHGSDRRKSLSLVHFWVGCTLQRCKPSQAMVLQECLLQLSPSLVVDPQQRNALGQLCSADNYTKTTDTLKNRQRSLPKEGLVIIYALLVERHVFQTSMERMGVTWEVTVVRSHWKMALHQRDAQKARSARGAGAVRRSSRQGLHALSGTHNQCDGRSVCFTDGGPITPSSRRRLWVWTSYLATFMIPSRLIRSRGHHLTTDEELAWREKACVCGFIAAINLLLLRLAIEKGHHVFAPLAMLFGLVQMLRAGTAMMFDCHPVERFLRKRSGTNTRPVIPTPDPKSRNQKRGRVLCLVTAFAEGESELRRSIDSLARQSESPNDRLICVVCDGNVKGEGNIMSTPCIVGSILGFDADQPSAEYEYLSMGSTRYPVNVVRMYYGYYHSNVHDKKDKASTSGPTGVPFLVISKIGAKWERGSNNSKAPGHRGKRDSHVLVLRFLQQWFAADSHRMGPFERGIGRLLQTKLGFHPRSFEFLCMVDVDTAVEKDSLCHLVAECQKDTRVAGICGETKLDTSRGWNFWTIIQLYDYYTSYNMTKACESFFGFVVCLSGCFCMYRIFEPDTMQPVIIADRVMEEYSLPCPSTLHERNMLQLGEDRYLTTLMLKHFSRSTFRFTPKATACTLGSHTWNTFLNQRRRWVNSTIHNLFELVVLNRSSKRWLLKAFALVDLLGVTLLPATTASSLLFLYRVLSPLAKFSLWHRQSSSLQVLPPSSPALFNPPLVDFHERTQTTTPLMVDIPLLLLLPLFIDAGHASQTILFALRGQWASLVWQLAYAIAFPIYGFVLPIYCFWHQDDYSWGSLKTI